MHCYVICTRIETGDMRKGAERGAVLVSGGPSSETGRPRTLPDLGRLGATRPHEDKPRDSETPPVKPDSRDQGCVTRALARAPLGTSASFSNGMPEKTPHAASPDPRYRERGRGLRTLRGDNPAFWGKSAAEQTETRLLRSHLPALPARRGPRSPPSA